MKLADLQPRQGKVDIEVSITAKSDQRTFSRDGESRKVCNATISDGETSMTLTLWNEQVEQIAVGDRVKITNGYVSEWQGEKQLSSGKYGKIEKI